MKTATAHEPGVHGVPTPSTNPPSVYSTRIRKPKRRPMSAAPTSSRGRTRASDQPHRSSRDPPAPETNAPTNSAPHSPPASPSPNPPPDPLHNNPSPAPDSTPDLSQPQNHLSQKNNKNHKQSDNNSPSVTGPTAPSAKATPWRIDEIVALAKHVLSEKTVDPAQLFLTSPSALSKTFPSKTHADLTSVIDHFKSPFDASRLPFAPKCGVSELAAALASQHSFLTSQKTALDAANEKHAKIRSERQRAEKNIDKLQREAKTFKEEIEKEKEHRQAAIAKRDAAEGELESSKRKQEKEREAQAARREDLVKAKFSELEMRRRLDRMRLKVAALRGEMVTPTVDHLLRQGPNTFGILNEDIKCIESDPLVVIREGVPMKRKAAEKSSEAGGQCEHEGEEEMEVDSGNGGKGEEPDVDEDAEETQLRLLRNRLAMCENEALEWGDTLESMRASVEVVTMAKARLEEEMTRLKQGAGSKSGGSGRGVGKGSGQSARSAAKLRAAARAAMVPAAELGPKKTVKKSRKNRPQRSLVPY